MATLRLTNSRNQGYHVIPRKAAFLRKAIRFGLTGCLTLALGACSGYSTLSVPANDTTEAVTNTTGTEVTAGSTSQARSNPNLASLVGFLVTEAEGEHKDYAGIAADGKLTDYSYDKANNCYDSTSTQIYDQGSGVFWVQDGDVITELRMARQDGNLILFRENINETGRVVYPGTDAVSASDLTLCG